MKSYTQQAIEFGEEFAQKMFDEFQKPEWRGENFTWDRLPDLTHSLAYAQCGLSLFWKEKTKNAHAYKTVCGQAVYDKSKNLIKTLSNE